MPNKMLIDATHPEETRVVVLRGNRVEEFDFESANRKQLRGNIYLAKVTRVEPSLQAAFVDYGGNRHGFLAFSEIHPDYYQIPVADRQALIDEEERAQRAADVEADHRAGRRSQRGAAPANIPATRSRASRSRRQGSVEAMAAGFGIDGAGSRHRRGIPASTSLRSKSWQREAEAVDATSGRERSAGNAAAGRASRELRPGSDRPRRTSNRALPPNRSRKAATSPASRWQARPRWSKPAIARPSPPAAKRATMESSGNGGNITEISEHNAGSGEEEVIESVGGSDAMEEVPERMPRLRRRSTRFKR